MTKNNTSSRIEVNPKVAFGKPVVRGTRIAVEFVLGLLESGWTVRKILKQYPTLSKEDILACLGYAKGLVGDWKVHPVAKQKQDMQVAI